MRRIAVVLVLLGGVSLLAAPAFANCPFPVSFSHAATWFQIADAGRVSAFAYMLSNPTVVNTGALDIACEELNPSVECLFSPNAIGDNIVTIETNWGNTGIVGCPLDFGVPRIVVVAQGSNGESVAMSVDGEALGEYFLELAHPSADCSSFNPLVGGGGRPTLVSFDGTNLSIQCTPVPLFTDCDPGSCGALFGACLDNFTGNSAVGSVYSKVAPCGTDPGMARGSWTFRSATDGAGNATFAVTPPADANCLYVGCTSMIGPGAVETGAVTGHIQIAGALAPSARALDVRAAQAQGNVEVAWRTESEFELAGFNILAHTSKGTVKVNDALIAGKGNGSAYTELVSKGSLKGAKSISVEAVLSSGAPSNITGPIDIGK